MLAQSDDSISSATSGDGKKPRHIAVIMDGNGRWARQRGLPRVAGHRRGVDAVRNMVSNCGKSDIPYLTLFAFSSENWRRPTTEVKLLIELLSSTLDSELMKMHEHDIRLRVIGDLSRFPKRLQRRIEDAEELTRDNTAMNVTIAINYGGRWDIEQTCRVIAERVGRGDIEPQAVTSELIESHLSTSDLPEPDLFIRTGGEKRISNFLLWQLAYTELFFTDVYWPDFDANSLKDALDYFAGRERRYGQTGEQIASLAQA
ncbi:MAG: isoprenyl transferase [Acidiferrobacterales bacterium]|nr:isoprenyl transferase [Acidiferrobacterales bacterium]